MARHTSLWMSGPMWSTGAMRSCHNSRPALRTLSLFCSDWGLKNLNTTCGRQQQKRNKLRAHVLCRFEHSFYFLGCMKLTWNTTNMQRIMQESPLTMAFSMMSQMLLKWCASIGCCFPSSAPRGRLLLLAANRLSWWIHMAPTWWSSWLITSPVATVSSEKKKSTIDMIKLLTCVSDNMKTYLVTEADFLNLPLGSLITWLTPSLWHTWWKAWFPGLHHWSM